MTYLTPLLNIIIGLPNIDDKLSNMRRRMIWPFSHLALNSSGNPGHVIVLHLRRRAAILKRVVAVHSSVGAARGGKIRHTHRDKYTVIIVCIRCTFMKHNCADMQYGMDVRRAFANWQFSKRHRLLVNCQCQVSVGKSRIETAVEHRRLRRCGIWQPGHHASKEARW